jgi:general secretion pathway protein C
VYDGSNAMLNAVNLRAGDVITAVNGQRLGDLEQDMMLFENWRSEPQLEIEIERDGSILTVSYAIPEQWR